MIVVDASAALRWFIPGAPGGRSFGLPRTNQPLVAPDLFVAEVRSAVLVYMRKKELKREQGMAVISTLDRLMAGYFPMSEFRHAAWALAVEYDHSPYDCFYIELARTVGSYVVTADGRMLRKFAGTPHGRYLVSLEEWRP